MQLQTLFVTLFSTSLVSAQHYYKCDFAKDNWGMIQNAYCDDYVPSPHTDKSMQGVNCKKPEGIVEKCPTGAPPRCCYDITGKKQICTSWPKILSEEDI